MNARNYKKDSAFVALAFVAGLTAFSGISLAQEAATETLMDGSQPGEVPVTQVSPVVKAPEIPVHPGVSESNFSVIPRELIQDMVNARTENLALKEVVDRYKTQAELARAQADLREQELRLESIGHESELMKKKFESASQSIGTGQPAGQPDMPKASVEQGEAFSLPVSHGAQIISVRGLAGDLTALVRGSDGKARNVRVGDAMGDGSRVVKITKREVQVRRADGSVDKIFARGY